MARSGDDVASSRASEKDEQISEDIPISTVDSIRGPGEKNGTNGEPLSKVGTANGATAAPNGEPMSKVVSVNDISSVPNGGLVAWLQVMGSFFLFFNSWGIQNVFGVYQTYYETNQLASNSTISWIGSIQAFLLMTVGSLTGPVYDAGYFRTLIITGTFLNTFGLMMLSLSTKFYQVLLSQAFCVGLGCGCLFVPSVAILSTYFSTRVGLAMGIAASGSSLGGVLYPMMWTRLERAIGFAWATRVFGFIVFGTLLIPISVMRVRVLPAKKRKLLDLGAFKNIPYTVFILGAFLSFIGLYTPFFFGQLYSNSKSITNPDLAFYLLPILNAASIFGRIIPNYLADVIGPFNVIVPCTLITGLLCINYIPVVSTAGIIILNLFYGFFSGSFVSLPPAVMVSLITNRGMIGTHMGMAFSCIACGVLIGQPIAGAILDSRGFTSVWIFAGIVIMAGSVILFAGRLIKTGLILKVKC